MTDTVTRNINIALAEFARELEAEREAERQREQDEAANAALLKRLSGKK